MPDKKDLLLAKVIESKSSVNIILPGIKDDITDEKYTYIKQGNATNKLIKANTSKITTHQINLAGDLSIPGEKFKLTIHKRATGELAKLKTNGKMLFDYLVMELTDKGGNDAKISFKLKKYMQARGITDEKTARKQILDAMSALDSITMNFTDKKNGKIINKVNIKISGGTFGIMKGIVFFRFNQEFFSILKDYPSMLYPRELYTFSAKYNPNSFYFLRKIAEHKRMNQHNNNANIIGVETLVKSSPEIAVYDNIENKYFNRMILEPFQRDMDAINTIQWHYCGKNGARAEEPDNYFDFCKLNIFITWPSYPTLPSKNIGKTNKKKYPGNKTTI